MNPALEALRWPLLVSDPQRLELKLRTARGLLRACWQDFQHRFLADPQTRPHLIFLPALLGSDELEEACTILRRDWQKLAADDCADDVQFHTWCRCGAAMRRAMFFDWLADRGAWSAADIEEAAGSFLGFALKHAFPVLTSRARTANNQAFSLALYCAVAGFLFGRKRAAHPTAKFLFDDGMEWLMDLIGLFPADGYGGEGSTYTSRVNTPLACWTAEFLRQVTGRDWLDFPFRPNGTTLRRLIEMEWRLLSPAGLLPPWDHYGWQRAIHGCPFAYLARISGDPRHLALIPALTDTAHPGQLAWGADDPLWTLLWWPEQFADYDERSVPAELFGWFLPRTGAALDDVPRRARLMQVWDACAGHITGIGRAHCDPNHLMFEYEGEPVFQDGVPVNEHDPWQFPPDAVLGSLDDGQRQRLLSYFSSYSRGDNVMGRLVAGIAPGLIGAANAVVVDEEPWYWPGKRCTGRPELYARENGLQIVRADCAAFYQPRYDVSRACRTSLWADDGFGIVHDTLHAASPHTWRWQVHLRPDVTIEGNSARLRLPGGQSVLLAWTPVREVRTTWLQGFPRTNEQRCVRLELLQRGASAEFAVLIAPEARCAEIRHVGQDELEVTVDERTRLFSLARPSNVPPVPPDVHELSDIPLQREVPADEWKQIVPAPAVPTPALGSLLGELDACLAQMTADKPDCEALQAFLQSPQWPVQLAAAEALGRCGCREAIPLLRERLRAEHADHTLYEKSNPNRWRLKTALIVALGRLGDRESVPFLGQILADGRDFYPVYSVAAQALGRMGGPLARAALAPALLDSEQNTRLRALAAAAALRNETHEPTTR